MEVFLWLLVFTAVVGSCIITYLFGFIGEGLFDPSNDRRLVERGIALALLGPLTIIALLGLSVGAGWIGWRTLAVGFLALAALSVLLFLGTAAYLGILKARVAAEDDDWQP